MTSLRRRIFIGSVLWTVGLLIVASTILTLVMGHSGSARSVLAAHVHGTLQAPIVVIAAVLCMVAGALQVRRGLRRIDDLRRGLATLHGGQGRRLDGRYPAEVQPLVDDLNALLAQRDDAVRRAVGKAGDLAHGLKTPLAVLARDAEAAETTGRPEIAASVRQQVDRMRRQIDYHLAHARAAASASTPGIRASVRDSADGLARAMQRLHADRGVNIAVDGPVAHDARVQREDLDEMLGNLLDNACKWARSQVVVRSSVEGDRIVITIDDDGPGIPEEMREAVMRRGVRADQAVPGSGLGLAIVRELVELYGGSLALGQSPEGGCRAALSLPRA